MPGSSLVEVEVGVEDEDEVELEDEVGDEVEVKVEVRGVGFGVRFRVDQLRYSLDNVKILFRLGLGGWVGGKIISRIRLTSAKVLVEVEAELCKKMLLVWKMRA